MENTYKDLLNKVQEGNHCVMISYLDSHNKSILKKILIPIEEINKPSHAIQEEIIEKVEVAVKTGQPQFLDLEDEYIIIEPFFTQPRLIIFGGGHVSKPLAEFADRAGFLVAIVDDRPSFANTGRFPEAKEVICESFENSFHKINFRKSDFVAIVTRGHRYDGVVLREVLKHDLSYIGMIGSRRRVKGMMKQLLEEGYTKEKIDQVMAPIGLDIAAITPDEIAISIVAQLIERKNRGSVNGEGRKFPMPEHDIEVIEKIIEPSPLPKALITILSAKGSVPRKAGAKMIAYYDGKTIGSIGGGCSEADILTKARDIMLTKGFSIEHVDMTGDVAESEGMVCGGVMDVLIEVF